MSDTKKPPEIWSTIQSNRAHVSYDPSQIVVLDNHTREVIDTMWLKALGVEILPGRTAQSPASIAGLLTEYVKKQKAPSSPESPDDCVALNHALAAVIQFIDAQLAKSYHGLHASIDGLYCEHLRRLKTELHGREVRVVFNQNSYVTVYESMGGWKAILLWHNPKLNGFWEPLQTGLAGYATEAEAEAEAREWAEAEGLEFRPRVKK